MCVLVCEHYCTVFCGSERERGDFIDIFSLVSHIIIQLFFMRQFCAEATIRLCKHILGSAGPATLHTSLVELHTQMLTQMHTHRFILRQQ